MVIVCLCKAWFIVYQASLYSAAPSKALYIRSYEVLDTLDAISFYKQGYYDRVSDELYEELVSALEDMKEETELPDKLAKK